MSEDPNARHRFALVLRIEENAFGIPSTRGWATLVPEAEPQVLAVLLRRQSRLIERIDGKGMLVRVADEADGTTTLPLMDHMGNMRDLVAPRTMRAMGGERAAEWSAAAEAYAAGLDAIAVAEEAAAASGAGDGRRIVPAWPTLPPWRSLLPDLGGLRPDARLCGALCAVSALALCIGAALSYAPEISGGWRARLRSDRQVVHFGEELAEGGSVRRLQGIAQAMGRRY